MIGRVQLCDAVTQNKLQIGLAGKKCLNNPLMRALISFSKEMRLSPLTFFGIVQMSQLICALAMFSYPNHK